ncbi:MAG TPA: PaaI family thioesterase [Ideonella sp.]|uniref:PaaI family thioesterase n=1 Tax=Ideonella sp. TaxID=1929293 RepID=UPI002E350F40|nr:PaaI family thioesterase [Ideonella sp.]HEX5684782.1 PaaI family thioesterase [Ideonella sp.]
MSKTKIPFPVRVPFVEQLGLELHACAGGASELRVDLNDAHMNSWEVAHGGVLMTMMDVAMAIAARSMNLDGPGVATIEMKSSFMRPAEGELRALGKLLHRTSTMAFCEASVFDADGHLCAHATGTFKYVRALPAKGRQLKPLQRNDQENP